MASLSELSYLKKNLAGPILRVTNPREHTTEAILQSYFREILVMARAYTRPTVEFEDLVEEGLMGLLDAIKRWDPEKAGGNPSNFHNLAIVRIKSNMFEYLLANSTPYTTPNYMARAMLLLDQIRRLVEEYSAAEGAENAVRSFSCPEFEAALPKEVSARLHNAKVKLQNLAESSNKTYEEMVDNVQKVEKDILSYEAQIEEFEESPEVSAARKEFLDKVLGGLEAEARNVLLGLMQGKTLEEVGEEQGFTRERARQIKEETLRFLQKTRMFKDAMEE